jgi:hypothetical protein
LTPYIDDTILFPSSMIVSKNKLECFTKKQKNIDHIH